MRISSPALAFSAFITLTATLSAGTIVSNGPATSTSFQIGGPNSQVDAVVWIQSSDLTGASISALIGSVDGGSDTVNVYLLQNVQTNVIASTTVTVGSFTSSSDFTPVTLFSGLSLPTAAYAVVLFNGDTSGETTVRWAVGGSTNNTSDGTFAGTSYSNSPVTNVSSPYLSTFSTSPAALGFTVTGDVATPEPGTFFGILPALAVVGLIRRRVNL